jgi:glycosyltransferase involved in cell wall biosynthesis
LYKAMKYFLDNPNEVKRMAKNARAMITSRYERNKFWKLMLEEYYRQIKNRIK